MIADELEKWQDACSIVACNNVAAGLVELGLLFERAVPGCGNLGGWLVLGVLKVSQCSSIG